MSIDHTEEQKLENARKYGESDDDIIARSYRLNKDAGDTWCRYNVMRYLERFMRKGNMKAQNVVDLKKARDYLNRMIEANEHLNKPEIIEE